MCVYVCTVERRLGSGRQGEKWAVTRAYMGDPYTSTAIASSEGVLWFPKPLGCNPRTQVVLWLKKILEERNKAVR